MNGNEKSPSTGQEGSGSTDTEQIDSGVSRRHILAGLAALGLLPGVVGRTNARVSSQRIEVTNGEHGTARASIDPGSPMYGSIEISELHDCKSEVSVAGYGYDDEEPDHVEMRVTFNGASVSLSCSPERARELADELRTAANYADSSQGDK